MLTFSVLLNLLTSPLTINIEIISPNIYHVIIGIGTMTYRYNFLFSHMIILLLL